MIYIIEHMEPELFDWCMLEYKHISETVDKVWFTNVNLDDQKVDELRSYGKVFSESVVDMNLKNACLLDMKGDGDLSCNDSFDYLIFGGILGDDPPAGRTKALVEKLDVPLKTLGPKQLSTDGAVFTASELVGGKIFSDLKFQDDLIIEVEDGEEIILPFSYPLVGDKPYVSDELIEKIKKDGFF
ncbi:hypothetical protein K9M79_05415 [Candidatus Woesearchaeota archaeon]|nr:hypothetical protein [Candidatus Woesearchaeota archaeon]